MAFPETTWTVLAEATLNGEEGGQAALAEICEKYCEPVDAAIRFRGVPEDQVQDLRQDFFVFLMKGSFFRRADPKLGKFRSFLLHALRNFLIDESRRATAAKRGGKLQRVELFEESAFLEEDGLRFDLAWAQSLYSAVLASVKKEVVAKRGEQGWEILRGFLTGAGAGMSYVELAEKLACTEGGAKAEVSRLRAKFREKLRYEVKQIVSAPHEIDEELTYLRSVMSKMWGTSNE